MLYRDADGAWHVLDYKTDRLDGPAPAHVARYYGLQQRAYGLAASRLLGETVEVVFTFLRDGEEVVWRPTPSALEEGETGLRDAVASWNTAVVSGVFKKTDDVGRCFRCGYRALCGR